MQRVLLKLVRVAGLMVIALSIGCSTTSPPRVAVAPPPEIKTPVPPRVISQVPVVENATKTERNLRETGTELERLIAQPRPGVPDAVLNRTACFLVFPAGELPRVSVQGFATCRNKDRQWTSPAITTLTTPVAKRLDSDLYLFVLSDRARRQLVHGRLDLRSGMRTAPGVSNTAILDQVSASADVFAYAASGDSIQGVPVPRALVDVDRPETERLYGHAIDTSWLLGGSTMSSTVASFYQIDVGSFFNAITPEGIIIHHTVLVPEGGSPETERALDHFHDARGFEVSCFGKVYHIAYHYLILPDGQVVSGRPERCEGAHAHGYNSYLGIALVGNFSSKRRARGSEPPHPTKAQIASLVRLCSQLRQKYHIPLQRIMPHSEVSRTECPGDGLRFDSVLAAINRDSGAGS